MDIETQRRIAAILGILAEADGGLGSSRIAEDLSRQGYDIKERMVRYYLEEMDRLGFTENHGRHGRMITESGRRELQSAVAVDRVGFVSANVDELSYRTTYDIHSQKGSVILNISTLPTPRLDEAKSVIRTIVNAGLGMGRFLRITQNDVGGKVTVGTVCGITLNGVLRANGIPMTAKFGGLLEVRNHTPVRFTQIIHYDGTTLDPIEIFIKGKMTQVLPAALTGNGTIGAGFREIPSAALDRAKEVITVLERMGLCTVLLIGEVGRPLLDVPVMPGRVGVVVAAGLNPIAALEETGIPTESFAMSTLCDADDLSPIF